MNVKQIVMQWLLKHGFDGLAGEDCGCLLNDLAPCNGGDSPGPCLPGKRKDFAAGQCCGLECSGPAHWHVYGTPLVEGGMTIEEFLEDAKNWQCDCGARGDAASGEWRWNGQQWEHWHTGQVGHLPARRVGPAADEVGGAREVPEKWVGEAEGF